MNSRIHFIALVIFCLFQSFYGYSQSRSVDLSVVVTSPANQDSIGWGDTARCSFYIKNNGPDSFIVGDTAQLKVWQYNLPMFGLNIAPGDSILQNNSVKLWNDDSTENAMVDFCVIIKSISNGFADPDKVNDTSCITFTLMGSGGHTAIHPFKFNTEEMQVAPNPAKNMVYLNLPDLIKNKVNIRIVDLLGRVHKTKTVVVIPNKSIPVDISDLSPGLYMVQLQTSQGVYSKKILIEGK